MAVTKKVAKPVEAAPKAPTAAPVAAPAVEPVAVSAPAPAPAPVAAAAPAPVAVVSEVVASSTEAVSEIFKPFTAMPEAFRANAEQGIEKLRAQYAAFKGNAESLSTKLEESIAAAQTGARVINGKVLDLFRAQVDANFAHMNALFNATSVSEAFQLQQDFAKSQAEALKVQSQDLADYAKQVAEQVAEPVKSSITLPFKAA